jgi:L-ascorbate metabolism protein UlaG (beta-lactamase superfamily)
MKQGTFEGATITALGHAGFVIEFAEKKLRIAFDPYDIKEEQPVDYTATPYRFANY